MLDEFLRALLDIRSLWFLFSLFVIFVGLPIAIPLVTRAFEYYSEHIVPARHHYPFELAGLFIALLIAVIVLPGFVEPNLNVVVIGLICAGGVVGLGLIYQQALVETGCPSCRSLLPFRRRASTREFVRLENKVAGPLECYSGFSLSLRKPYFRGERSWDEYVIRKYRVDRVGYTCVACQAEWDELELTLIDKKMRVEERAPEANRPKDTGGE